MLLLIGFRNQDGDLVLHRHMSRGKTGWIPYTIPGPLPIEAKFNRAPRPIDGSILVHPTTYLERVTFVQHKCHERSPYPFSDAPSATVEFKHSAPEVWYSIEFDGKRFAYFYPIIGNTNHAELGFAIVNWE